MTVTKWRAIPRLVLAAGMLALAGCGSGSEPLRRIDALEARVERLEQASRSADSVGRAPIVDSTTASPRP